MSQRLRIALLGATGSIGKQALALARRFPERFRVVVMTAASSGEALDALAREFTPELCVLTDAPEGFAPQSTTRWAYGSKALAEAAAWPNADVVLNAVVGSAGLVASLSALTAGKRLLLANKESLVTGGALVMDALKRGTGELIPVDSEHTAIFQCLQGAAEPFSGIILTASGGPLLRASQRQVEEARPEDVLSHPVWSMGRKITVDSATLMNKGLEVIEAHWIFGAPSERIEVLVHPQSAVHSAVRFADGAIIAQMGVPDMAGPIAYALSYPHRLPDAVPPLDLTTSPLNFEHPDAARFPCLGLAVAALNRGGLYPAVLNAANEAAVAAFLRGQTLLGGIPACVTAALEAFVGKGTTLDDVLAADAWARRFADGWFQARS